MRFGRRTVSKAAVAICVAAVVSACSRQGSSTLPGMPAATTPLNARTSSPVSNLAKARAITAQSCTFSAPGNTNGDSFDENTTAWLNSSMSASGPALAAFQQVTIYMTNAKATLTSNGGTTTVVNLPDSVVTISPSAVSASVLFNDAVGAWQETVPIGVPGNFFADGGQFAVTTGLKNAKSATWSAVISTDTPGVTLTWGWSSASYKTPFGDYNGMGVKPMDSTTATAYPNDDLAGTPENFKTSLAHGGNNGKGPDFQWVGLIVQTSSLTPCLLGSPGAGPTPSPVPSPPPPGSTPSPTPSGPTPTPAPTASPTSQPSHAAYITNLGDNSVSVINTATHLVTQTISVGSGPYGVAVNPSGSMVYVGNKYDGTISVINTATGQVTGTIALAAVNGASQFPYGIAFNPSGTRAYIASNDNNSGGSTAVIDTSTNSEIAEITAPSYNAGLPFQPVVSPDGTHLYVGDLGNQSVEVYGTSSNNYLATILLSGGDANGLAISPDGLTLYVCNGGGLSYASTATSTELAFQAFVGGCADVALNSTGSTAYVSNNVGNTVSVVNTSTHAVIATVNVGLMPEGISVSPSGTEVYVANANGNSVSVISTTSNAVTSTIAVGASPYAFGNFLK